MEATYGRFSKLKHHLKNYIVVFDLAGIIATSSLLE